MARHGRRFPIKPHLAPPIVGAPAAPSPPIVTSAFISRPKNGAQRYGLKPLHARLALGLLGTTTTYDLTSTSIGGYYVQPEGGAVLGTNFTVSSWGLAWPDGALRFKATCSTIEAYVYRNGAVVRMAVDGTDVSSVTLPSTSSWGWVTIGSGLDSGAEHTYLFSWGANMYCSQLRTTSGTINTARLQARESIAFFGDSITRAQFSTSGDSTLGFAHIIGMALGCQVFNRGVDGSSVMADGENRTTDVTSALPPCKAVLVLYGTNDVNSTPTQEDFGAAWLNMLYKLQKGLPSAAFICERLMKISVGDTSRDAYSVTINSQVTTMANSKITYASGGYTSYAASTGAHPTPSEYITVAAALQADIVAALASSGSSTPRFGASGSGSSFRGAMI